MIGASAIDLVRLERACARAEQPNPELLKGEGAWQYPSDPG